MRISQLILGILVFAPNAGFAQGQYRDPPPDIKRVLDAPLTPIVRVSPGGQWLLLIERPSLPSISEVAAPELRLAGVRINPRSNGLSRVAIANGLSLRSMDGRTERRIKVPSGARLGYPGWSPDGMHVSWVAEDSRGLSLWVADLATGDARRLTDPVLNGAVGDPCSWVGGGRALLCRFVVASRAIPPSAVDVPTGPITQESDSRAAPNRTYQDLLHSPLDEALFDYYWNSQLSIVQLDGTNRPVGPAGNYTSAQVSPDGQHILVGSVHRPYSYLVPYERFPKRLAVWDVGGRMLKEIADHPLQEEVPPDFDAVPTGPRMYGWRQDAPATVFWVEAMDGGDPSRAAPKRDRVQMLPAPFSGAAVTLAELETRVTEIAWGRADLAILTEGWWKTRRSRTWLLDPDGSGSRPRLLFDRSSEDRYADPGEVVLHETSAGAELILTSRDGRRAFLTGAGASPEGDRPFVDELTLGTGATRRIWRSTGPFFEAPVTIVDADRSLVLTRRESVNDVPNYYLRDLIRQRSVRLTDFQDPAPGLSGVTKRIITYPRNDGVQLSATLYLPPTYDSTKGRIPVLLWAYPQEFKTAQAAAQVSGSPFQFRFDRSGWLSHLFMLQEGYAVLDDPKMPIIGEGNRQPNDTYIQQLVASAEAAVNKVVELGIADRDRVAIGGHSYGAFMTANLLAHSRLFRAGIARSGAYNRTLTPFGFQAEERTFWQARDIYTQMSPFTYADQIKDPILLIHGMADDNSGTFPIQSERLYAALKGTGAKARLVMLPAERHGYTARESIGHVMWEMGTWLDKYIGSAATKTMTP